MVKSGGAAALVFVLSLLLGACASSGSIPRMELPQLTRTGVQPGDQVNIAFYTSAGARLAEVSGERTVDPNGELFLPFLGTVHVVGMETADIPEAPGGALRRTLFGSGRRSRHQRQREHYGRGPNSGPVLRPAFGDVGRRLGPGRRRDVLDRLGPFGRSVRCQPGSPRP